MDVPLGRSRAITFIGIKSELDIRVWSSSAQDWIDFGRAHWISMSFVEIDSIRLLLDFDFI